jgi:hypothetical protein
MAISVGTIIMENSMGVPQKNKNTNSIWFNSPTTGCISKGTELSIISICTPTFFEALLKISKPQYYKNQSIN